MVNIDFSQAPEEFAFQKYNKKFEKELFNYYFKICEGNQSRIAEMMGLSRTTVRKKLDQHNIEKM